MINDFKNINFAKYKRVFAFGCSFTSYRWPTWADIIGRTQCTDAEFINLGRAGAGNQYITTQLVQANLKYKFSADDLIMVMFTGYTREDKYLNNQWVTPGNIYTQGFYPNDYVEKYADVKGFAIRDLALAEFAHAYLENSSSDAIVLQSVPGNFAGKDYTDVLELHKELLIEKMPVSLYESVIYNPRKPGYWECGAYYYDPGQAHLKEKYGDYHPSPLKYHQYLTNIGIPLDDRALQYAQDSATKLAACETLDQVQQTWIGYENFSRHII